MHPFALYAWLWLVGVVRPNAGNDMAVAASYIYCCHACAVLLLCLQDAAAPNSAVAQAAQELPRAAAEALVDMYAAEAPDKLQVVKQALQRYL